METPARPAPCRWGRHGMRSQSTRGARRYRHGKTVRTFGVSPSPNGSRHCWKWRDLIEPALSADRVRLWRTSGKRSAASAKPGKPASFVSMAMSRSGPHIGKLAQESRTALRAIDLHFHDLRHEAGSRWLEAGMPLHHVKELLGHANISQNRHVLECWPDEIAGVDEAVRGLAWQTRGKRTRDRASASSPRHHGGTAERPITLKVTVCTRP